MYYQTLASSRVDTVLNVNPLIEKFVADKLSDA